MDEAEVRAVIANSIYVLCRKSDQIQDADPRAAGAPPMRETDSVIAAASTLRSADSLIGIPLGFLQPS